MVSPFAYTPGQSLLHRLDVRCKFGLLCLVSMAMLKTGLHGCLIWLGLLAPTLARTGLNPMKALSHLKWFILFLFLLFLVRALSTPGTAQFHLYGLTVTREGIWSGAVTGLRFFILMVLGLVFTITTRPAQVKAAAQWFLTPIPLVPEKRVAVMISLALGFLPLILKQLEETRNALNARCIHLEKNPIKRALHLSLPLLRKTFSAADRMVLSMESRCYDEDRTDPEFSSSGKEGLFLVLIPALAGALCFLP